MVSLADLEATVKAKIEGVEHVQAVDISGGCGQSYEVVIVASSFKGKAALAKHRMVNTALKEEIGQLHAFVQKTYTPEQWAKTKTIELEPAVPQAEGSAPMEVDKRA